MFSKISQLLESIKETLAKADKMDRASQPIKRVTYRLPSNIQRKDTLVNRQNTAVGPSSLTDILKPRGDGRITGVPVNEHSMIRNDPAAIRERENVVVKQRKAEMKKLKSPKQHKGIKEVGAGNKPANATKLDSVLTLDPAVPKITPEQSQPKKLHKQEGAPPAPPEGNSQGQPLDYKFKDSEGKAYGANRLEEEKKKKGKRVKGFFRKSISGADLALSQLDNGDLELEVIGSLPIKVEAAIKKMGFIPE